LPVKSERNYSEKIIRKMRVSGWCV